MADRKHTDDQQSSSLMLKRRRPTLHGCGSQSKLPPDLLDHWVYEACKLLGTTPPCEQGVSENVTFLSRFFDTANINLRHAGGLGWVAHWVNDSSIRTPDFLGDTFMESWCQAFAAKYCSEEKKDSDDLKAVQASQPDVVVKKRERTQVAPSRRSLFD